MTIQEMLEKKREYGYTYEKIAELSGLPLGTVQKVLGGITKSPRYDTLDALERVFTDRKDGQVSEALSFYDVRMQQGGYTLKDYYALPDERRVELIDGVIYDMSSPTSVHQLISGEVFRCLADHIRSRKGRCVPILAPMDVQLDCDSRTMVQPDVLVVCDRKKIRKGVVYGAPDLVVEILSPSTRRKDMYLKSMKYAEAGVREYWMVDPDRKKVLVYLLEEDDMPAVYGFDSNIPVRIFGGECKVDFTEIYKYISFLYEEEAEK